jgi:hypothetical protein
MSRSKRRKHLPARRHEGQVQCHREGGQHFRRSLGREPLEQTSASHGKIGAWASTTRYEQQYNECFTDLD